MLGLCVCVCVCERLSDTALTEKAAFLTRRLSLLSLTAAQRLNSDTAERALIDSWTKTRLLRGSGSGGWVNSNGTMDRCLSMLLICSHTSDLLTKPGKLYLSPLCSNIKQKCTESPKGQLWNQEK